MGSKLACIQLGAREHYAVPRALTAAGSEVTLVTDLWSGNPGGGLLQRLGRGADRFHPEVQGKVVSWNHQALVWELGMRLLRRRGWALIEARNGWFRRKVAGYLRTVDGAKVGGVMAYSYCALEALEWARGRGIPGLLGQIDPGPTEERIVRALEKNRGAYPSESYWRHWKREAAAASLVVVNSEWSRQCLIEEGIAADRIVVIPLAYEAEGRSEPRSYPDRFSPERPLRVLFLGQVIARKGVAPLLDAMAELAAADAPVVLDLVGGGDAGLLARAAALPNCRVYGPCRRSDAGRFYREADVFILPTFSDGFALTQLEAQAAGLPVIASRHCGDVVRDGVNGLLLDTVDAQSIRAAIERLLVAPAILRACAARSAVDERFSLRSVGRVWLDALQNERHANTGPLS